VDQAQYYAKLPEHGSVPGADVSFEEIVGMCVEAGLVRENELFFDSTKVEANAVVDSLVPR
jgi:hypothetical protein